MAFGGGAQSGYSPLSPSSPAVTPVMRTRQMGAVTMAVTEHDMATTALQRGAGRRGPPSKNNGKRYPPSPLSKYAQRPSSLSELQGESSESGLAMAESRLSPMTNSRSVL
jgi:hypothetical protein